MIQEREFLGMAICPKCRMETPVFSQDFGGWESYGSRSVWCPYVVPVTACCSTEVSETEILEGVENA